MPQYPSPSSRHVCGNPTFDRLVSGFCPILPDCSADCLTLPEFAEFFLASWPPRPPIAGPLCHLASPPAIYGEGFVKPICRFKSMEQKSARLSPSPSASVDLPHLSRRPAGVCAFCRISLEPEAEGDYPTASVRSSWGRRVRERSSIYSGSSTLERTSPGKRYPKDAAIQSNDDPRWGSRLATLRGHPSKSSRPPALRLDKTFG